MKIWERSWAPYLYYYKRGDPRGVFPWPISTSAIAGVLIGITSEKFLHETIIAGQLS